MALTGSIGCYFDSGNPVQRYIITVFFVHFELFAASSPPVLIVSRPPLRNQFQRPQCNDLLQHGLELGYRLCTEILATP